MSEYYRVCVKVKRLTGFEVDEIKEYYPVYAATPEDAANSVIIQKAVKKEQIISVSCEQMY